MRLEKLLGNLIGLWGAKMKRFLYHFCLLIKVGNDFEVNNQFVTMDGLLDSEAKLSVIRSRFESDHHGAKIAIISWQLVGEES
jgi:hypothetical protein